jgi:hypothetical protein
MKEMMMVMKMTDGRKVKEEGDKSREGRIGWVLMEGNRAWLTDRATEPAPTTNTMTMRNPHP